MKTDHILIKGLRQNNLKNISLEIPKKKIVVFTGVSGSGKSSIVFDTIAAESQRQMNETYTAWIRGRLPQYEKPNVEYIDNLNPSVVIDQSRLGNYQYGRYTSDFNGCGWMAVYNMLHSMGFSVSPDDARKLCMTALPVGGLIGTQTKNVVRALDKLGVRTVLIKG